jgi:hypothetical protein
MKLLIFAVSAAAISPFIASANSISLSLIYSGLLCVMIWSQEILVIQLKYRRQNIEFTRRFKEKFTGIEFIFLSLTPHFISLLITGYVLLELDGLPSTSGFFILIFSFMILVRIFDPLLGCISSSDQIPWISMGGYVIVFSFATSSAIDPTKLEFFSLPLVFIQSIILALMTFTILNLRIAYYRKYCFEEEQSLETQLRLVLIPLLILSTLQFIRIIDLIDISNILGG